MAPKKARPVDEEPPDVNMESDAPELHGDLLAEEMEAGKWRAPEDARGVDLEWSFGTLPGVAAAKAPLDEPEIEFFDAAESLESAELSGLEGGLRLALPRRRRLPPLPPPLLPKALGPGLLPG